MKPARLIKALFVSVTMLASVSAHAEDKKWTQITIATEGAFRPYNFTNADGSLDGYEIELSKYLCAQMKIECTVVAQPFDGMIPALNAGKFDAIMAGMSATPKREEVISFSTSYGITPQTFAVLKSSPLATMPHSGEVFSLTNNEAGALEAIKEITPLLDGKAIGVQTSAIAVSLLDKYFKDVMDVREYKTTDQHDLDLKSGRVDLVIASQSYLSSAIAKPGNEDIVITGPRFQGGVLGKGVAVGLRKDDAELKAMFDAAIETAKADGTIKALAEKWFGFDITPR